jgi:hypothetical protein
MNGSWQSWENALDTGAGLFQVPSADVNAEALIGP